MGNKSIYFSQAQEITVSRLMRLYGTNFSGLIQQLLSSAEDPDSPAIGARVIPTGKPNYQPSTIGPANASGNLLSKELSSWLFDEPSLAITIVASEPEFFLGEIDERVLSFISNGGRLQILTDTANPSPRLPTVSSLALGALQQRSHAMGGSVEIWNSATSLNFTAIAAWRKLTDRNSHLVDALYGPAYSEIKKFPFFSWTGLDRDPSINSLLQLLENSLKNAHPLELPKVGFTSRKNF